VAILGNRIDRKAEERENLSLRQKEYFNSIGYQKYKYGLP